MTAPLEPAVALPADLLPLLVVAAAATQGIARVRTGRVAVAVSTFRPGHVEAAVDFAEGGGPLDVQERGVRTDLPGGSKALETALGKTRRKGEGSESLHSAGGVFEWF